MEGNHLPSQGVSQGSSQTQQGGEPSIDDVIKGMEQPQGEPEQSQAEPPKQEEPAQDKRKELDAWHNLTKEQREVWKMKKQMRDEREALKREREEIENMKKDPKKLLGLNKDNVDDVIDRLFEEEKDNSENNQKSYEEIYKEIEERVTEQMEKKLEERDKAKSTENEIREFNHQVKEYLSGKDDSYQLVNAFGEYETVTQVIEAQFQNDAKAYGEEKAKEMMLNVEQAAERVEKYLETEINKVLQYKGMREYITKLLGQGQSQPSNEQGSQNNYEQNNQTPNTLNNSDFSAPTGEGIVDDPNMNDEEAFQRALSLIGRN